MALKSIITGTGSYIPEEIVTNQYFSEHKFYAEDGKPIETDSGEVVEKFKQITGIAERRYAREDQNASDIATIAAQRAIEDSGVDPETLDQIIQMGNILITHIF